MDEEPPRVTWMSSLKFLDPLRSRAKTLKRDTLAVWYASLDPRTPRRARVLAVIVAAYAFSPVDLIPDFVPILGYLDDLILIPAGIALTLKMIPPDVMADARLKAEEQAVKPVSRVAGAIIFLFWLMILFFIIRAVYRLVMEYN